MGIFEKLFNKKESEVAMNDNTTVQVIPQKPSDTTIDMSKSAVSLSKVLVDISKTSKIDMSKHTARVALAMDYSGSMGNLFSNGSVQDTITRLLPIALKFDDNGELESWLFSNGSKRLKSVDINNYKNYAKKVMMNSGMSMGGTNYAPVLKDITSYYNNIDPSKIPAFIIFITDGDNWDTDETNKIIRKLSDCNMFIQFIGIGNERFEYLRSLDNMKGRKYDNTGFTAVKDMNSMSDEELYTEILRQYKDWLNSK